MFINILIQFMAKLYFWERDCDEREREALWRCMDEHPNYYKERQEARRYENYMKNYEM